MKVGLVHYNFPGELDVFLDYAAETGFAYTELQASDIWPEGVPFEQALERAQMVKKMLADRGLAASAVAAQNDFLVTSEEEMDFQVQRLQKVAHLAEVVGTRLLRVDGGWPKDEVPQQMWMDLMVEGFSRCRDFIEEHGFYLALDNHGLVTNNADLQISIFKEIESDNLGANLDTMNYRWAGHPLEVVNEFYRKIAPYVLHCHLKDGRNSLAEYVGTALGEGELDLDLAVQCLKAAGYNGVWCVEYEGKTDPAEGYRKGLQWVREHVGF